MPRDSQLAREQWQRYEYARDMGHLRYLDKAYKCEAFFAGDQWDQSVLAQLREQRRPGLTMNKILGTLSSIMGEQIDLRTEIAFKGRYGAPSGTADTLTKLQRYISDQNQMNWLRSELFADGAITGRGYIDVRMDFDKNVSGDVKYTLLNPKNVLPDPDAYEYDPDTWNDVIVTKWLTADDIEYMYNSSDADALRASAPSTSTFGFDSMDRGRDRFAGTEMPASLRDLEGSAHVSRLIRVVDRQYRKLAKKKYFVDLLTGDRKEIPESWERDQIALYLQGAAGRLVVDEAIGKKIRWVVTAEDFVLHEDWSPYRHFTPVPYFPFFRYGNTIGLVENLIDPQELLNKSTSQELHVINTTANSGWKVKKGALANMTPDELEQFGAATGLVIEVDGDPDSDVVKITPNQIPQGLDRLSAKGDNFIKTISMRGDAQMGMTRADVSGKQIEANRAAADVGLRKPLDNLARTDFLIARNTVDMVQEFYKDERIVHITSSKLTGEQEEVKINYADPRTGEIVNDVTLGEYEITVIAQPAKQTLEESQFEQGSYLREKLGVPIPDEFLIENSNLINKTGIIAALKEKAQSPQVLAEMEREVMSKKLELANLKADAAKAEADAILKRAKAQKEVASTADLMSGEDNSAEVALEAQKHQQQMQHEREKHEMKMQQEREKHEQKMALDKQKAEDDAKMKRAQALLASRQKPAARKAA